MRATLPPMPRARRVAIVLASALLALPAGALAQGASGAGDEQYGDPFGGGSGSGQSSGGSRGGGSGGSSGGLTQTPDLGGSSASGSGASTPDAGSAGSPADPHPAPEVGTAGATLPNTGTDPRQLVLAGLALLLSGLGLRLRTADEAF